MTFFLTHRIFNDKTLRKIRITNLDLFKYSAVMLLVEFGLVISLYASPGMGESELVEGSGSTQGNCCPFHFDFISISFDFQF